MGRMADICHDCKYRKTQSHVYPCSLCNPDDNKYQKHVPMTLEKAMSYEWGTFGKSGKEPMRVVYLSDCTSEHLVNIIKNIQDTGRADIIPEYIEACRIILEDRKVQLPEDLFEVE